MIFVFGLIGFMGAALFYWPYVDEIPHGCPLCPHVTIVGSTPISRFLRLALPMGLLNALLFSAIGWLILKAGSKLKQLISH